LLPTSSHLIVLVFGGRQFSLEQCCLPWQHSFLLETNSDAVPPLITLIVYFLHHQELQVHFPEATMILHHPPPNLLTFDYFIFSVAGCFLQ